MNISITFFFVLNEAQEKRDTKLLLQNKPCSMYTESMMGKTLLALFGKFYGQIHTPNKKLESCWRIRNIWISVKVI